MDEFNYGKKKQDGQYENHPCEVKPEFVTPLRDRYTHNLCGGETIINSKCIVETYASNPNFYGSTFCVVCKDYFPLVKDGERQFKWSIDSKPVGE